MTNSKKSSKILVWLLSIAILCTFSIPNETYASSIENITTKDNVQITIINKNKIYVKTDDERLVITRENQSNDNVYKTTFTNVDTGEENYFILNENSNTFTSSITGKTFSVADELDAHLDVNRGNVKTKKTSGYYKKISYRTLYNALGTSFTVAALIAAVMGYGGLSLVIGFTQLVVMALKGYLKPGATTKHGIKIWVTKKRIKKHQGGKIIYVTVKQGKYKGRY